MLCTVYVFLKFQRKNKDSGKVLDSRTGFLIGSGPTGGDETGGQRKMVHSQHQWRR